MWSFEQFLIGKIIRANLVTDPDEYPDPGPTIVKTNFDDDENALISKIIVKIIYPINHHDVENWVLWLGPYFVKIMDFLSREKNS